MTQRSTELLTEMSIGNLPGTKGRLAHKADNLTAVSRLSRKCGILEVSQTYGPSWRITGLVLHFTLSGML
jgi:hypothetical protein